MPFTHQLQSSRYELKYIVDELTAGTIRDFVQCYLVPDEHASPDRQDGYVVQSLYLDSPDLVLYRQTIHGIKNRFKLRIRLYDDDPASPVYLEIKRRTTDVVRKERTAISREGASQILDGRWPDHSHVLNGDGKSINTLHQFCTLRDEFDARGSIFVAYLREPYVLPDSDQVRVTFDRQVMGRRYAQKAVIDLSLDGTETNIEGVVLELKFTDRFPVWMCEIAQNFNLTRRSVPKYVKCVQALAQTPSPWAEQPWSTAR